MRLRTQLKLGASLLLAVAAGISAYVFLGYAGAYRQSVHNLRTLASCDLVLKAANAMSAERGPSNILLSLDRNPGPVYAQARIRLDDARKRTDLALDALDALMRANGARGKAAALAAAQATLAQGRAEVDALMANAPSARSPQDLQSAIDEMVAARVKLDPLIGAFYSQAVLRAPDQAGTMQMAYMLSDLREFGGRIGSMLIVPLSTPEPISPARRLALESLRGRIDELHRLLPARIDPGDRGLDDIDRMRAQVERGFFDRTLPLIDGLLANDTAHYPLRAAAFTQYVMPDLMDLETLEDLFMRRAAAQVARTQRDNRRQMLLSGACLLAFIGFLLAILRAADRVVIRPLLLARQEIIDLATGDTRQPRVRAGRSAEVRALHEAIDTLRARHLQGLRLAAERDELSKALRRQAYTDALTGLLNRHALTDITGDLSAEPALLVEDQGLILLDVDYFKPVNDAHGHIVGDLVLREVARRIKEVVGDEHLAFRYGGEEFAVLATGLPPPDLCRLAEAIRHAIARDAVKAHGALELAVTASFGVARGSARATSWFDLLNAADIALYRAKRQGRNQLVAAFDPAD